MSAERWRSFDDSSLSPGDTVGNDAVANGTGAVGTLTVSGNFSHSTFTVDSGRLLGL